jgi:hypothetical protein
MNKTSLGKENLPEHVGSVHPAARHQETGETSATRNASPGRPRGQCRVDYGVVELC